MIYEIFNLVIGVSVMAGTIVLLMGDSDNHPLQERSMLDLIEYIIRLVQIVPMIVMGASLVCALTPTPKDDQWVGKIYRIIDWCALNIGKAKEK